VTAVGLDPLAIEIDYEGGVIIGIVIGAHTGLGVVTFCRSNGYGIACIHASPR
jgi:hypothetical protein